MANFANLFQLFAWFGGLAPQRSGPRRDRGHGEIVPAPTHTRLNPARPSPPQPPAWPVTRPGPSRLPDLAWGARVSAPFKRKVVAICQRLEMSPDHLMAVMAFETGRSFDPAIRNHAGSGATGLIQFMPRTAIGLGTTVEALAQMNALIQLDYVEAYLRSYKGRMRDLPSAYMAVLYPRAVDKPGDYVLFRKGSKAYKLNSGLDGNNSGQITKEEASAKVADLLKEGLQPGNLG